LWDRAMDPWKRKGPAGRCSKTKKKYMWEKKVGKAFNLQIKLDERENGEETSNRGTCPSVGPISKEGVHISLCLIGKGKEP